MNIWSGIGRLTKEPDVRDTAGGSKMARYTLACDRRFKKEGDTQTADFIPCVAFGRSAEFAEMYLHQGMKIAVTGRIQTGSYTKQDGPRVYTTDIIVDNQEFCEKKGEGQEAPEPEAPDPQNTTVDSDGFMDIPDGLEQEQLPFH